MENLITKSEFKAYKEIRSTSSDDILDLLIPQVSAFIKEYCRRSFIDYSSIPTIEYFDGVNTDVYFVKEYPIIDISEVAYTEDGGSTYIALTPFTDYVVDTVLDGLRSIGSKFTINYGYPTFNSIRVTYTGGFLETPDEIKLATIELVDYYRQGKYVPKLSASGDSIQTNDGSISRLPPHIKRVLDLYRGV